MWRGTLVAASADDHEFVAGGVTVDGHEVVAKGSVEAGRRLSSFHLDLVVQVDVFGRHFVQGASIDVVDERLYVCIEKLRRFRLRADVG